MPAHIVKQFVLSPPGKVEWRIRHNEICLELRMAIIEESVGIELAKVSFNSANSQIHVSELPCGRVRILTIHRNIVDVPTMALHKFL